MLRLAMGAALSTETLPFKPISRSAAKIVTCL
jgi:hypothetical protein